jgi:hypothetical protein
MTIGPLGGRKHHHGLGVKGEVMDDDVFKTVAAQVVDQAILHNWECWLLVMGIVLEAKLFGSLEE